MISAVMSKLNKSNNRPAVASREELVEQTLTNLCHKLQAVRYPAILDSTGEVIYGCSMTGVVPQEFGQNIVTMKRLATDFFKIFSRSKIEKFKILGQNKVLFNMYVINDSFLLVFYADLEPKEYRVMCDHSAFEEEVQVFIEKIKHIICSSVDIIYT